MTDKKSTSITWALVITSIITLIGWFTLNYLNFERERKNRLRDIKISYLLDAYRKLANASQRPPNVASYHRDIEAAIADIQLFGTEEQVQILLTSLKTAKIDTLVRLEIDPVLNSLKNSLRNEIDLQPINDNVQYFRFSETTIDSSKKKF